MAPLVSVIIPTYNRAHLLVRAIDSVLDQTFTDYELIVVDDGSQDETQDVLAQYVSKIRIITQDNRGVAAARNNGIKNSNGELVAFLDSDDQWLPEKLERQTQLFQGNNPHFICHTGEIWIRNGKEVPQKEYHRKQGGYFFERALERCLISPSSVLLSRKLLDVVGLFDEELPAAEDYDLWLRITAYYKVDFISEPLIIKHGGSPDQLSMTTPAIDRFRIRAIEKILQDPALPKNYYDCAVRELKRKCEIVASGCDKKGNYSEAKKYRELARSFQIGCDQYQRIKS